MAAIGQPSVISFPPAANRLNHCVQGLQPITNRPWGLCIGHSSLLPLHVRFLKTSRFALDRYTHHSVPLHATMALEWWAIQALFICDYQPINIVPLHFTFYGPIGPNVSLIRTKFSSLHSPAAHRLTVITFLVRSAPGHFTPL